MQIIYLDLNDPLIYHHYLDFIGFINSLNKIGKSHEMLLSNLIGQTKALMQGKSEDEVKKTINQKKNNGINIDSIIKSKSFEGNKPSTTILFDKLTPYNLGKLIELIQVFYYHL